MTTVFNLPLDTQNHTNILHSDSDSGVVFIIRPKIHNKIGICCINYFNFRIQGQVTLLFEKEKKWIKFIYINIKNIYSSTVDLQNKRLIFINNIAIVHKI